MEVERHTDGIGKTKEGRNLVRKVYIYVETKKERENRAEEGWVGGRGGAKTGVKGRAIKMRDREKERS